MIPKTATVLEGRGYRVPKSRFTSMELESLYKEFTVFPSVIPAYGAPRPAPYYTYAESESYVFLPRFSGLEKFGLPDYVSLPEGAPLNSKAAEAQLAFPPRPNQLAAAASMRKVFATTSAVCGGGGIVSLPCGYGKTYMAIWLQCTILRVRTIVVVTTGNQLTQFLNAYKTFWPEAKVGVVQGDRCEIDGCDAVVAMLHSLCQPTFKYSKALFRTFGLAVFDECHHLSSDMFRKALMRVRTKYILGLSATPRRNDGLEHVFRSFLGPIIHMEERTGSNRIVVCKVHLREGVDVKAATREDNAYAIELHDAYKREVTVTGVYDTNRVTTKLSHCRARTDFAVVESIVALLQQPNTRRNIIVVSGRKRQLEHIEERIRELNVRRPSCDGKVAETGMYVGFNAQLAKKWRSEQTTTTDERVKKLPLRKCFEELLRESATKDVVLGISNIAKEGLDIADRNTLVLASPPGPDVIQVVGRILRKYHVDVTPVVVDIVDHCGNYVRQSRERDKFYKRNGYVIVDKTFTLNPTNVALSEQNVRELHTFLSDEAIARANAGATATDGDTDDEEEQEKRGVGSVFLTG